MAAVKERDFPRNYPTQASDVLMAMSLSHGENLRVIGSASLRSVQFIGDYDANEIIHGSAATVAKGLQAAVRRLDKISHVVFGDIKCGGTYEEPLRWTPGQILKGHKGNTTLVEAVAQDAMRKIDVVALVSGRYIEMSCVYLYPRENPSDAAIIRMLKEEIKEKIHDGNYWKALKRYFSILRLTDAKKAEQMVPIFNGDLGRLYSVIADISTMLYLLENERGEKEPMRNEIDNFRSRLAGIWRLREFIKREPGFDRALEEAAKGERNQMITVLTRLTNHFNEILQNEAKLLVKKWGM